MKHPRFNLSLIELLTYLGPIALVLILLALFTIMGMRR